MHCRKSVLFGDQSTWTKKNGNFFDVAMGSYDGAEICELVGLYLLHELNKTIKNQHLGLYRDDGLAVINSKSGPVIEKIKKIISSIFQNNGLKITTESNLLQTDFLDITLNLTTGKYWPYRKPGDIPLYINAKSNHPPNIKKQLPKMISSRLSRNSYSLQEFDKTIPEYQLALEKSGYREKLTYVKEEPKQTDQFSSTSKNRSRNRTRKIIWFNPPFNDEVTTNIGKEFFTLLNKHFPRSNKYHKIFNKNNIKLSYSCMPNMKSMINKQNTSRLNNSDNKVDAKQCNCRSDKNCPLNGKCCRNSVVYKASLKTDETDKFYYGSCETSFKLRYNNHNQSFKDSRKINSTELSKAVWKLKQSGLSPEIRWKIVQHATPYQCGSKTCNLCLSEKLQIFQADPNKLLNKRSELVSKCRHRSKFKLRSFNYAGS